MNKPMIFFVALLTFAVAGDARSQVSHERTGITASLLRAPEEGGARRWQVAPGQTLTLHAAPAGGASQKGETLLEGTVLTNYGCSDLADSSWCDVRPFHGGVRGFVPAEGLMPVQGPDGVIARGVDDSGRRARRRKFDASGEIPCAQGHGQELGICNTGVARSGGGDATVAVTFGNGFSRLLHFTHGEFVRANPTMSGVGTDSDWRIESGQYIVRVDTQRFKVPIWFVTGHRADSAGSRTAPGERCDRISLNSKV